LNVNGKYENMTIEKEDIIDKMSLINFTDVLYNMTTHNLYTYSSLSNIDLDLIIR